MEERWPQVVVVASRDELEPLEQALFDAGALSVTEEDAGDHPILEPAPGTTPLWERTRLRALFAVDAPAGTTCDTLRAQFPQLEFQLDLSLTERDWEREWLVHFRPMRFGERLWVVPRSMAVPAQVREAPGAVAVRLDPGLAFGTGTHPSTASCLRWLDEELPRQGAARLLDYGCGSGILAVAALRLGAARVTAVDLDPQALTASAANAEANAVRDRLALAAPNQLAATGYDVVVANILAGPLVALASRLAGLTRAGGRLKLAGILVHQAADVAAAYAPWFSSLRVDAIDAQWARICGTRKTSE